MNLYIININKYYEGYEYWLLNQKQHRIGNASTTYSNGAQVWFENGMYHRINGPAVISYNGAQHWFLNGKKYSKVEYQKNCKPRIALK